jgi:DNA polymerase-3 subunit gamma/tau
LKTLEEPPAHAVFILATTELDKLPETVISRCQTFTYKKPSQKILKDVVLNVAKKEGFSLEQSSAELVALLGDGSFRDTLSILQKVIGSSKDKKISVEEVELVTGAPRATIINDFIAALDTKDAAKGIKAIHAAGDQNIDMAVFLKLALHKIRSILLLRYSQDLTKILEEEFSAEDFAFLSGIAAKKESGINSKIILELLNAQDQLKISPIQELPLELMFAQ